MADETTTENMEQVEETKDMHVQYTFKKIDSVADTIKLDFNGIDFMTFNKADYTSADENAKDFDMLLGKSFDISPIDCNDLSKVKLTGSENHAGIVASDVNSKWIEYAHNKLGSKHFADNEWLATLDNSKPIQIYNQGQSINSWTALNSFLGSIPFSKLSSDSLYDLSKITVSSVNLSGEDYSVSRFLPKNYKNIAYSYNIPEKTKIITNYFKDCIALIESPYIPDTVYYMESAFQGCSSLKRLKYPLPLIESSSFNNNYSSKNPFAYTFKDCISLEELPIFPNGTENLRTGGNPALEMFSNCVSIKKIEEMEHFPSILYSTFLGCTGLVEVCDIPDHITELSKTFKDCTSITELPRLPNNPNTYIFEPFNNCNSITKVRDNKLLGFSYVCTSSLFGNPNQVSIDNIDYIEINGGKSYTYGFNIIKNIGIVNAKSTLRFSSDSNHEYANNIQSMGQINFNQNIYIAQNNPYNIIAFPYYLEKKYVGYYFGHQLPTSTGYEWWVDYIETDTEYVKTITNRSINLTKHIDTLYSAGQYSVSTDSLITVSPEYKHEFELDSVEIESTTLSSKLNCSKVTTDVDGNNVTFLLDCTNIVDDSVSSCELRLTVNYVAHIDGYEFHGKTIVDCNIDIDFTVVEDIQAEFTIKE